MLNNDSTRPRMQLTKPVQTGNAGLVTPKSTTPPELGSTGMASAAPLPGGPQLPTTPSAPMSYLDIARNAIAQLTDDEVQTLLAEVLDRQTAPSAADMFNEMKGAPNGI